MEFLNSNIYFQLLEFQAYIAPPIVSVLLVGIVWKNASARGAIWALLIGGLLGILKIILSLLDPTIFQSNSVLNFYNDINSLHFAVLAFILSSFVILSISFLMQRKTSIEKNDEEISIETNNSKRVFNQIFQKKISANKSKREIIHK